MDGMKEAAYRRQLRMARFAMHKNAIHKYYVKMEYYGGTESNARSEYDATMENFDQILQMAVDEPARMEAVEADMKRGFYIPTNE